MLGQVQINKINLKQGESRDVTRKVLFIGRGAGVSEGSLVSLGLETDLEAVLGSASALRTQIEYARDNAGQNWTAAAFPLGDGQTWEEAVDTAMEYVSVEGIALTDPVENAAQVENMQRKSERVMARYMRPLWLAGRARPLAGGETFQDYQAALRPLTAGLAADSVTLTPSLWGYELGAYLGRLCNRAASIADSPMRVASGPLVGNWAERPLDASGRVIDLAVLAALDADRFSVPQLYPDYEGTYWADGNTLDVSGGDFGVIENLRVIHECMRQVYPLAVARVADRSLNQTPASLARARSYFLRPLRKMAKSSLLMGQPVPGDILPPTDEDISLTWLSRKELVIGIAAQPYNSPKKITVNLALDLTPGEE